MADNLNCENCFIGYRSTKLCLKCHKKICFMCDSEHLRHNPGHVFDIPSRLLEFHNEKCLCRNRHNAMEYKCVTCNDYFCKQCVLFHENQNHTTRAIDELYQERIRLVEKEILSTKLGINKLEKQLKDRQLIITKFSSLDELSVKTDYNQTSHTDSANICNLSTSKVKELQNETKHLQLSLDIHKLIESHFDRVVKETSRYGRVVEFLEWYSKYLKYIKDHVNIPFSLPDTEVHKALRYFGLTAETTTEGTAINAVPAMRTLTASGVKEQQQIIDQMIKEKKEVEQRLASLQNAYAKLKDEFERKLRENEDLKERIKEVEDKMADLSLKLYHPRATESATKLQTLLERKDQQLSQLSKVLKDMVENIKVLTEFSMTEGHRLGTTSISKPTYQASMLEEKNEFDYNVERFTDEMYNQMTFILGNLRKPARMTANEGNMSIELHKLQKEKMELEQTLEMNKGALTQTQTELKHVQDELGVLKESRSFNGGKMATFVSEGEKEKLALENKLSKSENLYKQTKLELDNLKKEINQLTLRDKDIQSKYIEATRTLEKKKTEIDDLKNRLSQVAGAKLTKGNSSIADLGDRFRPTRIAELYSEMYDNEWTEAVDVLTKGNTRDEDTVVKHLFIALQVCYESCFELATREMDELVMVMLRHVSADKIDDYLKRHTTEFKQLYDARKGVAVDTAESVAKDIITTDAFKNVVRRYHWVRDDLMNQITCQPYFAKCSAICWLMVVQDPPMVIDREITGGTVLNKELYRAYTKSGSRILFSVLPALFLHKDGPLLVKGVAQLY